MYSVLSAVRDGLSDVFNSIFSQLAQSFVATTTTERHSIAINKGKKS